MSALGLISIIIGWVIQYKRKDHEIDPLFILLYGWGVVILVMDGFISGLYLLAFLNAVSLVLAALMYLKLHKRK